jgi:hypothetical protein
MQVASDLLEAFGEGCSNNGTLSSATQKHGAVMVNVLEKVKDAPECSTLPYAVASLNNLQANVNKLLKVSDQERDLLAAREQEKVMLLALASAQNDPEASENYRSLIKEELLFTKQEVARTSQYVSSYEKNQLLNIQKEAYSSLVSTSRSVFGQGAANQLCWSTQREILSGITAAAASVVSSAVSSAISIPLSAGAELTGQIMEIVRQSRINKQISKVAIGSATRAYQCTMEQLSSHWCAARDAKLTAKFMLKGLTNSRFNNGALEALRVHEHELPAIVRWLERVRIAAEPANVSSARQQAQSIFKDNRVTRSLILGIGVINQHRPLFNSKPDRDQKWFEIRAIINEILDVTDGASAAASTNFSNPIYQIYDPQTAPFILLGRHINDLPRDSNKNLRTWSSFNALSRDDWGREPVYVPSIDELETQFREWMRLAALSTQGEFQQDVQANPLLIIQEFFDVDLDDGSVYSSLTDLIRYLETKMSNEQRTTVNLRFYGLTLESLKLIKKTMEDANNIAPENCLRRSSSTGSVVCQSDIDAIGRVAVAANLNLGVTAFEDSILRLLRVNLNDVIRKGVMSNDIETVLIASYDILRELDAVRGFGGPTSVIKDANAAQSSTQDTLNAFGDTFAVGIKKVIENYNSKILQAKELGDLGANTRMKADLCFKLLALPVWPKKLPTSLCEGVKIVTDIEGGPRELVWSKELLKKELLDRACAYHDFQRDELIFARNCQRKGQGCTGVDPRAITNRLGKAKL